VRTSPWMHPVVARSASAATGTMRMSDPLDRYVRRVPSSMRSSASRTVDTPALRRRSRSACSSPSPSTDRRAIPSRGA
jgi:hypothetical protein